MGRRKEREKEREGDRIGPGSFWDETNLSLCLNI